MTLGLSLALLSAGEVKCPAEDRLSMLSSLPKYLQYTVVFGFHERSFPEQ